ncbi:alpha-2,8-sialyltransferase 8F-like [Trematomus bernacchii]|uniref:alpha-2,8-sialyltransferase 8F-like n=1 Tax=Trematomus bernacchii TaxID=40690 RepID=UPI00146CE048|nr:alpha-2,8-sialyltransferase 8F-like [Trematomus bernacchii]
MKGQISKSFITLMITVLCLGSLLITALWIIVDNSKMDTHGPPSPKKNTRWPSDLCKGCRALIEKVRGSYSKTWKKQEGNSKKLSSQLRSQCHGFDKAIITQANTPVGSKIMFSLEGRKTLQVTPEIFSTFSKENLFQNKTLDTCAVVGNSGILSKSSCGEMIDSAQFVIRCNLPALGKGYEKDVGIKTDIVTANPSIIWKNFGDLERRRRPFVESLRIYGNSRLLLPAFTFARDVPRSLRAVYTAEDFESPMRPVFLNPDYIRSLTLFWSSRGQRKGALSSGLKMVSLALEHCANVHLYGFWPFTIHPFEFNAVNNHYFDNGTASWLLHAMPDEFDLWLKMHSQGVLRLHLGKCQPGTN